MPLETDVAYLCPFCNEENFLGIDPAGGTHQRLVEDCPVCCRPIVFMLRIDHDGDAAIVSADGDD